MISNILSKLFKLGFILSLIGGLAAIYGQVMQKPLRIPTGKDAYMTFSQPGISVCAQRNNSFETAAPDTTINYMFRDSNNRMTAGGGIVLRGTDIFNGRKKLADLIAAKKGSGEQLAIDTVITMIGQRHTTAETTDTVTAYMISNGDSTDYTKELTGKSIFFTNMAAARKYDLLKEYYPLNRISQENNISEVLRIMPSNAWQHAGFVFYDLQRFACLVLLLLCLSRLFGNFSKKSFFTRANVMLLKRTGWLLLIPSLAAALLYWILLVHIHPVKLVLAGEANTAMVANYEIAAGMDWTLIFLGAGLLVLGYIFNNGLAIKEEQALTI